MLSVHYATTAVRRGAAVLAVMFALLPVAGHAQDATGAQSFVQTNVQNALSILQDRSLAPDQRRERIHALLLSLLDAPRIAIFTLGSAQATASPADLAAYNDAFREFMVANYDTNLGTYSGETLNVTGSTQHAPGDYVVSAVLVDPSGSANGRVPPEVDFRILYESGRFYIVDASVQGVWLAVAQRDGFQGFLKEHNGNVAALTAHLREMTATMRQSAAVN